MILSSNNIVSVVPNLVGYLHRIEHICSFLDIADAFNTSIVLMIINYNV